MKNQQETSSKAGRHRVYTNDQRKDRNRQAQAAFRNRRNKYTKTLEIAMLKVEETIADLKIENEKSVDRAVQAESRCSYLENQISSLQKMLELTLANNQPLLNQSNAVTAGTAVIDNSLHLLSPFDNSQPETVTAATSSPMMGDFFLSLGEIPINRSNNTNCQMLNTKYIDSWLNINSARTDLDVLFAQQPSVFKYLMTG